MIKRAILTWFVLAVIGVANGVLREATYGRLMSDERAGKLSTLTAIAALFGGAYLMMRGSVAGVRDRALLAVGAGWTLATIVFEFGFGRLVAKDSWEDLLRAYDVRSGELWSVIPATILIAPLAIKRLSRGARVGESG